MFLNLQVLKELDRELKSNHTLVIKATENCSEPPAELKLPIASELDRMSYHSALTRSKGHPDQDWFNRYKHSRNLRSIMMPNVGAEYDVMYDTEYYNTMDTPSNVPKYQSLLSGALSEDGTLVQVVIYVQDINDNAPEFVTKVFTGGLTTAADFGTKIMQIRAIDKDDGINARLAYYQIGDIRRTLTEGLEHLSKPPFLVDQRSGAVILNFDPQKGMKGYFDFMVSLSSIENNVLIVYNILLFRFWSTIRMANKMPHMYSFICCVKISV